MQTEPVPPLRPWMRAATAYTPKFITALVGGTTREFYPISTEFVFMLQAVAKPLGKALAFMQGGDDRDRKFVRHVQHDKGDGVSFDHLEQDPTTVELATFRAKQREKAIDELCEALAGNEVRGLLGAMICDSMRPRGDLELPTLSEGREWLKSTNIVDLGGYLKAFYEANKEVLGPLVRPFLGAKAALVKRISETLQTGPSDPSGSPPSSDATASPSSAAETPMPLTAPEPAQG